MTDELIIRAATEADIPRVREIAALAWTPIFAEIRRRMGQELYQRLRPDGIAGKSDQVEEGFRRYPERMWVAEIDWEVVGFITFWVGDAEAKVGVIGNNAVHPDRHGRGVGRRMYQYALDWMRQQGLEYASVQTGLDDAHAPARRAYEAVGFDIEIPSVMYYRKL